MSISSSAPWLKYYGDTPQHLKYPQKTIYEMVKSAADKYPKNYAYEFMGKKTTYAEFMQKIDAAAKAYMALGIQKGDRVTICMPNCPQAVDSFYALNRIGAVSNMIHPLSAAGEIKFYLNFSKSKAILTLDQFYGKIAPIMPELSRLDLCAQRVRHALLPHHVRKRLRPVFPIQSLIHASHPTFVIQSLLYTILKKNGSTKVGLVKSDSCPA